MFLFMLEGLFPLWVSMATAPKKKFPKAHRQKLFTLDVFW
jgi:hypothetical protein